jgi:hypothetical protein
MWVKDNIMENKKSYKENTLHCEKNYSPLYKNT